MIRVILDKTKNEYIVKCPNCSSIFSYGIGDGEESPNDPIPVIKCPCCNKNYYCYEYKGVDE